MRPALRAAALAAVVCAAAPAAASAACTPKSNLEAIVDDSSSMSLNDPDNLRVRAMELLIGTQGNEQRTLGAVEFGTDAAPLFGPAPIGQNADAFKLALNRSLRADGGGTDYNAAFAAAKAHNPGATARIFLTDGEHTASATYANGHQGGPPTYVLGLGAGAPGGPSEALLGKIAKDTGGLFRRAPDAGTMQAAMFDLNSAIACQAPPRRFRDSFRKLGQSKAHLVTIPSRIDTAQFALTWSNRRDRFTIAGVRVVGHSKRKLKLSTRHGATFTTIRVSRLVPGKLRFVVRASKLADPGTPVALTTQVTRKARR